jgi:hypothetical protein
MTEMLFDLFITGKLVNGLSPDIAQNNFARLFKTTPEKVSRYFSGEPQLFKRGIDKAAALRYKEALHTAGVLVSFMAHKPDAATSNDKNKPTTEYSPSSSDTSSGNRQNQHDGNPKTEENRDKDAFTLAPVGSDVLRREERREFVPADIDTSSIKVVPAFVDIEPEEKNAPLPPDTTHLTIAAAGEDLLLEKPEPTLPLPLDLASITLAPPGTPLDEIHEDVIPLNPDVSALSLAPPGADLTDGQEQPATPSAPDTSHISI